MGEGPEEAEALALEFEVWRELMEERTSLLAQLAGGSETRAAPAVPSLKTAPIDHQVCCSACCPLEDFTTRIFFITYYWNMRVVQSVQVGSKVDVSAAMAAKRKTPHAAAIRGAHARSSRPTTRPWRP